MERAFQMSDIRQVIGLLNNLVSNSEVATNLSLRDYIISFYEKDIELIIKKQSNLKKTFSLIGVICNDRFATMPIMDIDTYDVILFLSRLETEREISKATVNRYRSRLMAIFNHAIHNKYLTSNPVSEVVKYREYPRGRFLSSIEVQKLLLECKESRNSELYSIVMIALYTGMRFGEIINLRYSNFYNNKIFLNADQTKTGLSREIPINCELKAIIDRYVSKNRKTKHGKIFKSKSIRSAFEFALERSGIASFRFHDLRRTFATKLKDKNVDIHSISRLLGHTNTATTERYLGYNENKMLDIVELVSYV